MQLWNKVLTALEFTGCIALAIAAHEAARRWIYGAPKSNTEKEEG